MRVRVATLLFQHSPSHMVHPNSGFAPTFSLSRTLSLSRSLSRFHSHSRFLFLSPSLSLTLSLSLFYAARHPVWRLGSCGKSSVATRTQHQPSHMVLPNPGELGRCWPSRCRANSVHIRSGLGFNIRPGLGFICTEFARQRLGQHQPSHMVLPNPGERTFLTVFGDRECYTNGLLFLAWSSPRLFSTS